MGSLCVKFWGTRGLIASPRPETAIFGGNTPSLQILHKDHLICVDTGFGCANLGDELGERIIKGQESLKVHIFYTHFHWDHIQGLPFFKPIYFNSTSLDLYSPEPTAAMLENLDILFDGSYSPFESLMTMPAAIKLHQLTEPIDLDGLKVEFRPVDHACDAAALAEGSTYAYKFTSTAGETIVLMTDHEARASQTNQALVRWGQGADLLIHDGHYLEEEYARHVGWGHSSANQALDNALKMGAKQTLLTHHAPSRNDKELQALHRSLMQNPKYRRLNFEFAREEIVYEVTRAANRKVG